jgi:hypothetical protein
VTISTLASPLTVTGNFVSETGVVATTVVTSETHAGRVLAARVDWAGGGAHAVVIMDYSTLMQVPRYYVADPIYGNNVVFGPHFTGGGYQGSGTWKTTCFTKAPSP